MGRRRSGKKIPQIANPKICVTKFLRLVDLLQMRQFADRQFAGLIFSLRFAGFVKDVKTSANLQQYHFLLINIGSKFSNLQPNFRWFCHERAEKRCFFLSFLQWKIYWFAISRLEPLRNLRINQIQSVKLQFADWAALDIFWICDSWMRPKMYNLQFQTKIKDVRAHLFY